MELKRWRVEVKGWTHNQLADVLGCTPRTVSRYEDGWRIPRPQMIEKIASLTDGAVKLSDHIEAYDLRKRTPRGQRRKRVAARTRKPVPA